MNNKKLKKISLILTLIMVISSLGFNKSAIAEVPNKPSFDIEMKTNQATAMIGEDITISGTITPRPFETEIPAKEIVLVLDISNSMNEKIGNKLSKLEELRIATKDFIKEMRTVENLKISIVKYGNYGDLLEADFLNMNDIQLDKYLNENITTPKNNMEGGTNTGEGLRKALYLLKKGQKGSSKTLVLMTDGIPTYHSLSARTDSSKNFYLTIDNTKPSYIGGTGQAPTNNSYYNKESSSYLSRNYAIEIGKLIAKEGYNTYSIGYGIGKDSNAAKTFKYIHESMSNKVLEINDTSENIIKNEENGFFLAGDNAISSVFKNIAIDIINSYPVNNLALNITFEDGFSLNIGGNKVDIGNITYTKVEGASSTGKARYEAKPIPFSFIVKATKAGYQKINSNISLSYQFKDEVLTEILKTDIYINVESNELPNISAKLLSPEELLVRPNGEITLKYEVNPANFGFTDINNASSNDVAIIIDTSKDMKEEISIIKNAIFNKLLSNDTLKNTKTQYSLITFSNKSNTVTDLYNNKDKDYYKDYNKYITDLNDQYLKNINAEQQSPNAKSIKDAFSNVIDVLKEGRRDTGKTFIIIGNENTSYNQNDIKEIKEKGYNVITLSVDNDKKGNLYALHKDLNGKEENYFYIQDANSIENSIMGKVAEILISGIRRNGYEFNPIISLNLSGNFDAVSGIEKVENNMATVKVPKIEYKYNSTNGLYEAKPVQLELTIKAKMGKFGELTFGNSNDNRMIYEKLMSLNNDKYKYSGVKTPKITVKPQVKDLSHGLYSGVTDNKLIIENSTADTPFELAANSTLTYGVSFILTGNEVNFTMKLDPKFSSINSSEIKVYLLESGKLIGEGISVENTSNPSEFKLRVNDSKDPSKERQVVLIYKKQIIEVQEEGNKTFTNEIMIEDLKATVTIKLYEPGANEPKLPDLF